jgi:hypothetical protein
VSVGVSGRGTNTLVGHCTRAAYGWVFLVLIERGIRGHE